MKTFLEEIAKQIGPPEQWGNTTIIFPNRRAGVFFRNELSRIAGDQPVYAPEVLSLEDYIFERTPLEQSDTLTLTGLLFESYTRVFKTKESFSEFFFWGKMILRDFDDLDQHIADAKAVYSILEEQKQLDLTFGFTEEEQLLILKRFWGNFSGKLNEQKKKFLDIWKKLYPLYNDFHQSLIKQGIAYKGLAYRTFATNPDKYVTAGVERFFFAGFNALTRSEEAVLRYFLTKRNATILWDIDEYYINKPEQEAGRFFREMRKKNLFQNTFPPRLPNTLRGNNKKVDIIGVPYRAGQAKYIGQEIKSLIEQNPELPLHKIAIVLPDEQLLFSVLNSLPQNVTKVNVTMGFPAESTTVFSLLINCLTLQEYVTHRNGEDLFYFRPLQNLLTHPVLREIIDEKGDKLLQELLKKNQIYVTSEEVSSLHPLLEKIFVVRKKEYTPFLLDILQELLSYSDNISPENLTAIHFIIIQLRELMIFEEELVIASQIKDYKRFLRQLLTTDKIPFEGEPLEGLQIMGVLETRNLDFEHVFVLSMNEDFFPADSRQKSFIPYNIRKAYNLPVFDQQDAIYAYLFYRLFHRSSTVTLLYNTEGNTFGGQEMSRFLHQLIHEKPFETSHQLLNTPVDPKDPEPILITKDDGLKERLETYLFKENQPGQFLYPSAINTYLHCRMQFYFKYVAKLKENDEIDEEVNARLFGNIFHNGMERLYKERLAEKSSDILEKDDFKILLQRISKVVDEGFKEQFNVSSEKFEYTGQNIIQREMLLKFMKKIIKTDMKDAPVRIIALETDNKDNYSMGFPLSDGRRVGIKGKIDRLDEINGYVRVIDYKTGKDDTSFKDIEELFNPQFKFRNKAALQTLCYAMLYDYVAQPQGPATPGLISRKNLFNEEAGFSLVMKKHPILDYRQVKEEFEEALRKLLDELFDENIPFDQTDDDKRCVYCAYKGVCQR